MVLYTYIYKNYKRPIYMTNCSESFKIKVLYVTASCLTRNTSANMSHNSYVQGLLENGASVDIVMASNSWGKQDFALPVFRTATYHEFSSVSFSERLRRLFHKVETNANHFGKAIRDAETVVDVDRHPTLKQWSRTVLKRIFYLLFPEDPLYPLEKLWLRQAVRYKSNVNYDLVVSNSSPAASHRLVANLIDKKHIRCKRWVQIWEDPWYHDLYGGHPEAVLCEELSLLQAAQDIYYVSPLTLHYQQQYFPDCAAKMHFIPLPFLSLDREQVKSGDSVSFGYFGDYYSRVRNLLPFYEALVETGVEANIFGDSDLSLKSTDHVNVSGRVTLDVLQAIQQRTTVLVHLCNLRGGQIPGKIYHYSATEKPILFIIDGTEEEQEIIKKYFSRYNRYLFCYNDKESIISAIKELVNDVNSHQGFVVQEFSPKQVVATLLEKTV